MWCGTTCSFGDTLLLLRPWRVGGGPSFFFTFLVPHASRPLNLSLVAACERAAADALALPMLLRRRRSRSRLANTTPCNLYDYTTQGEDAEEGCKVATPTGKGERLVFLCAIEESLGVAAQNLGTNRFGYSVLSSRTTHPAITPLRRAVPTRQRAESSS